ncbi:MAG: carboxymuconolactone decarboxylase family protein [bacterium]|nr:carboxymuconolactone decarboxylase family protein [bacterium]
MAYGTLFEAIAARPEIARTLAAHVRASNDDGSIPRRLKELIALMVGWLNACDYCTCVHEEIAQHLGITTDTLAALGDYARSPLFSEAERAALAATISLTREPRALPPNLDAALREHFTQEQYVEVVAAIGLNNYLSRLSNALGVTASSPA